MAQLFGKGTIKENIQDIHGFDQSKIDIIQDLYNDYKNGLLNDEVKYKEKFNKVFFGDLLGYEDRTHRIPEGTISGIGNADLIFGNFEDGKEDADKIQIVCELKGSKSNLVKKQFGHGGLSPVGQGFAYKTGLKNCKWLIVSNFYEIRLYRDNQTDFEERNLQMLLDPKDDYFNLKSLFLLLQKDNLLAKEGISNTEKLLSHFREEQQKITKKFYKEYKELRFELIQDMRKNNPSISINTLVEKAQKIIDRLIFIFFCEDKGLLPDKKLKEGILNAGQRDISPWDMTKRFFAGVNSGSEKLGIPDGYNGGLFKEDVMLNNLLIGDEICRKFVELTNYDFDDELSVNVLGHIFEQSISDLEELKEDLIGRETKDNSKGKRKKDGIFYTPEYIVDYIVQNSVMKYLNEKEDECLTKHKSKKNGEILAYQEYQQILQNIKVLDPACGSGAFLVRVFDVLFEENKRVGSIVNSLFNDDYYFKNILTNNIYGVDLNAESVEITKLSLWLKSAQKGKKLNNLDANIKCGNSLIDDKSITDKAFDWSLEFKVIMDKGGFDVVVGNPPYVKEATHKDAFNGLHKHPGYQGKMDLRYFFGWLALEIIKPNSGLIGFIAPNNWITNDGASKFRNKIIECGKIIDFVDFGDYKVFESAGIQTMIYIMSNSSNNKSYNLNFSKILNKNINVDQVQSFLTKIPSNDFEFFAVKINKENITNSTINFINNNKLGLLDKIKKSANFWLQNNEIFSGIDIGQDFVNGKSKEILGNSFNVGDGVFNLSDKEYKDYSFSDQEKSLIKTFYTTNEINRYFSNKKNKYWVIYTPSKFKNMEEIIKYPTIKKHLDKYQDIITSDNKPYGLHRARNEFIFKGEKILFIRKCFIPSFSFVDFDSYVNRTFNIIKTDRINLKYLTALLNSSLVKFWLKEKGKLQGDMLQVDIVPVLSIPLKSGDNPQPFIERADKMLSLNKDLHELTDKFFNRIQDNLKIEKITKKLEKFYEGEFKDFLDELKKQKVSLSLSEQDDREPYFKEYKEKILALKGEIKKTDKEIDEMVYELYGLTEEEVKVVEGK